MKLSWRLTLIYLAMAALSLFFFWIGHSVQDTLTGISVDWGVVAVSLLLPASLVFVYAHSLSKRVKQLYKTTLKMTQGKFEPVEQTDSSDEIAQFAKTMSRLSRQVEQIIQEATQEASKMEAIMKGMQEGVIALDHLGRVLLINNAAKTMFNCQDVEVKERYLAELVGNGELHELVIKVLQGTESINQELTVASRILMIQINSIVRENGQSGGAVLVSRDVTELRHLEQVRTDFVANVSHELRTPLTSIKGFVETLLDGAVESPDLSRRFLKIIDGETLRLQRLIEDLLSLTRLEQREESSLEKISSRVDEAYKKIRPAIASYAYTKGLSLDVDLPNDLPPVKIGEDLLSQVLLNLMENAVKYTEEGKIWVNGILEGEYVKLEFGDTGCGIPEDSLKRIFERFYRVDKARSREQGGTGLGLSIVKHIIEGAGGKITVRSQIGVGSVFTCLIPRV